MKWHLGSCKWTSGRREGGESSGFGDGGGREAVQMRKLAGELGAITKKAVEGGGSSMANLITLINEIKVVKHGAAEM